EPFARQAAVQVLVEQPVMAQFVGGDMASDLLQDRLGDALAQRGVVGAGADLDDAPRDHLAGARTAPGAVGIEIDLESVLKPGEGGGEIKARIGQRRPAGQSAAVLDLFLPPAASGFLELGIVGENPAQMMGISGAIVLDEARRLDDAHDVGFELIAIEAVPRNVVERPGAHTASGGPVSHGLLIHQPRRRPKILSRGAGKALAADFGERLELGAGDALLSFEMAQFRRQPLTVGASRAADLVAQARQIALDRRSEEHTSELQSPYDLVCRLLLEKK